jgi:hypothetical protein
MISPRVIRFACPVLVFVGLGAARAERPPTGGHAPSVAPPIAPPIMVPIALPTTVPRRVPRVIPVTRPFEVSLPEDEGVTQAAAETTVPDPLQGTPAIRPETTGTDAVKVLDRLLPGRSDTPHDWHAPVEPLHRPCEPRALPPCVPPPPCHPSAPPNPYDLVGVAGCPSCGPIYGGPCAPRTGTPHQGMFAWYHRLHDRFFDHFYMWK